MVRLIPVLLLIVCVTVSAESTQPNPANMVVSSELYPESSIWFTQPPDLSEIRYKLTAFDALPWSEAAAPDRATRFVINPRKGHQTILGIGTSLEETSVYAMVK